MTGHFIPRLFIPNFSSRGIKYDRIKLGIQNPSQTKPGLVRTYSSLAKDERTEGEQGTPGCHRRRQTGVLSVKKLNWLVFSGAFRGLGNG